MVDASELAFRDLCRKYGAQLAYTPMLHSASFVRDAKYRAEHFTTHALDRPLVAQFCANEPATFVNAAKLVQNRVDAVDLNLGCPQGIARRGCYGAFLMDHLQLVRALVSAAAAELAVPVWVKIRVFDDVKATVEYARMLEEAGASLIAVHGRTREQKGRQCPPADWDKIRAVVKAVNVPVIANGNVRTKADANRAMQYTGAEGVMSAYALLDYPAVFGGVKLSRMQLAYEYINLAERRNTPLRMVRLHLFKLFRSRLDANMDLNEAVAKCRCFEDFRQVADTLSKRCDFEGVSFEQRIERGEKLDNVVSAKRIERLKRKQLLESNQAVDAQSGPLGTSVAVNTPT
ncbi:tRNA-dihydrouridine(16/17) synthase [NAD(P)(+)]-like [Gracilariopsis chorda]|uniref:tRNA-dihydrouridine(16/17) synthase [NAD(P)(+)] n=1 Tax=Gracilariopsis chorda TaxID=448386 RepID=A0A2V3IWY3_9FLOR|nr:tRNA-dihydrouridine(16/17) synthase [NAD(P)(+)]-like [Gracilariopsis chorda]|eukprot:PXF46658.1 tRNA-dihydrouridine(16/17) synthase [NAD(P)(+)]-like [Gracilariopsis chorda]